MKCQILPLRDITWFSKECLEKSIKALKIRPPKAFGLSQTPNALSKNRLKKRYPRSKSKIMSAKKKVPLKEENWWKYGFPLPPPPLNMYTYGPIFSYQIRPSSQGSRTMLDWIILLTEKVDTFNSDLSFTKLSGIYSAEKKAQIKI